MPDAAAVIAEVQKQVAKIPLSDRPSIYIARGPHGLESAVAGSIGSEVVDLVGARNVVGKDTGPRTTVASMLRSAPTRFGARSRRCRLDTFISCPICRSHGSTIRRRPIG